MSGPLIVHEASRAGGIGAEIAGIAAKEALGFLDAPIEKVCPPYIPVPVSPPLGKKCISKKKTS